MFVSIRMTAEEDNLCCGVRQCGCSFKLNLNDFTTRQPIPDTDPIYGYTMEVTDYEALGRAVAEKIGALLKQNA